MTPTVVRKYWRRFSDGRGVIASAGTSLLARAASAGTTLIAMPVALHTLGDDRFAAFLLLFGVINWIILGNFGVHSALGRAIASKTIATEEIPSMLGTALVYAAITTGLTTLAVTVGFVAWARTTGVHLRLPLHEFFEAGFAMIALSTMQIVLQVFEGVQMGNLKLYVVNLIRLLGCGFTFACLLILPRFWPSMVVFVVALNGGVLLGAIANAAYVMREYRPDFSRLGRDLPSLRRLAGSGLAFLVLGVVSLFQTHVPVLLLAMLRGAVAAIDFGLLIRLVFVLMTGLSMVTAPLWPAISSARSVADYAWVRKSVRFWGFLVVGAGAASCLVMAPFGAKVLHLWTGRNPTEPLAFQVLFGIYFLQMAWSHYWGVVMIGLSRERLVSVVQLIEGLVMITTGSILAQRFGATGMILGLVAGFALISNWFLPLKASHLLRTSSGEATQPYTATEPRALHAPGAKPAEPCLP